MPPLVLLVDDDENFLHGLVRALRHQPYHLLTTRSGEEAIWTLKTRPVDLLVADDRMPGMSGCDLVAWVAEHYPEVTRIILTGNATVETALRAINEGSVHHFFTKPCSVVQLAITIRKALERKSWLEENQRLTESVYAREHLPADLVSSLQKVEDLLGCEGDSLADAAQRAHRIVVNLLGECRLAMNGQSDAAESAALTPSDPTP